MTAVPFDASLVFIAGRWRAGDSGQTLPLVNPSDGSELTRIARGNAADIDAAVQAAQREQTVRYEVMLRSANRNVVDPEAAVKLIDLSSLEFGEDGTPTNIDKALDGLLKQKPYLVKSEAAPPPNTNARNGNEKADTKAKEDELRRRYRI